VAHKRGPDPPPPGGALAAVGHFAGDVLDGQQKKWTEIKEKSPAIDENEGSR